MHVPELLTKNPSDQQVVIIRGITPETEKNLQMNDFGIVRTQETNIFNALLSYLKNAAVMESNYCCCP